MSGSMEFNFQFTQPQRGSAARIDEQSPMRILVLADFSGRENRGVMEIGSALAKRRTTPVDVDNFEAQLARLAPQLRLPLGESGAQLDVKFTKLDDFHPDHLYQELEVFASLRQMRRRLLDPSKFAQTAAELRQAGIASPAETPQPHPEPPARTDESASPLALDDILSATPDTPASSAATAHNEMARLIESIVAPYCLPKADPKQAEYVASVDEAIAATMQRILHHPAFQAMEAAWRGVDWLMSRLEVGTELKIDLLDISKPELAADLEAAGADLKASGVYKLLVERGVSWSLLVGDYTFTDNQADVRLLAAMGAIASCAGGPFLAAAAPKILGVDRLTETPDSDDWPPADAEARQRWQALRSSPVAAWLGLSLPRILLRLPYGQRFAPAEQLQFEELAGPSDHEAFLWGSPAIAWAILLGQSFLRHGWSMQPGEICDLTDLPAYVYHDAGEALLLPCSEVFLTQRSAEAIRNRGIMPWQSFTNQNAVRLAGFQSLADPPTSLAGPWRQ